MQNTSAAVMEQRAPRHVEGDDDKRKLWRDLDFFPTPPWAARAGIEMVRTIDREAESMWEPACGEGHIAGPAREYFEPGKVIATDIHNYNGNAIWDFLSPQPLPLSGVDWVITNPPFANAAEFVSKGLYVAERGVAVLCRMAFLESATRFPLHFKGVWRLNVMAPFMERVPMQLGSWDPGARSATAYAWFIYCKKRFDDFPVIRPIPPGTRARLTRPDDAAHFGGKSAAPLFDGETDQ